MERVKTIWFLWYQGGKDMPSLVKECYNSWCEKNKDFEIVLLDKYNIEEYVKIDKNIIQNKYITIQALSDIIRINLLNQQGGIWVDATCYCMKPINSWINKYIKNGFFAFSSPSKDRLISSWFMASEPNNTITREFAQTVNNYWLENPKMDRSNNLKIIKHFFLRVYLVFTGHTNDSIDTSYWFSFFIRKILKIYPYFWFHYLFYEVYTNNSECRLLWDNTIKYSADIPHKMQLFGLNNTLTPSLRKDIDSCVDPLYKLSLKIEYKIEKRDSVINYLLKWKL